MLVSQYTPCRGSICSLCAHSSVVCSTFTTVSLAQTTFSHYVNSLSRLSKCLLWYSTRIWFFTWLMAMICFFRKLLPPYSFPLFFIYLQFPYFSLIVYLFLFLHSRTKTEHSSIGKESPARLCWTPSLTRLSPYSLYHLCITELSGRTVLLYKDDRVNKERVG